MIYQQSSKTKKTKDLLLLVDDDDFVRATISLGLRNAEFGVLEARTGEEAIKLCDTHSPTLAILDVKMPGLSGIDTAKIIFESAQVPFIFLSAFADEDIVHRAITQGALGYLIKPVSINQIIPSIKSALGRASDIKALIMQQDNLHNALSQSRETSIAVGIVMSHTGLSAQQAENALRHHARKTRQKMSRVSTNLINRTEDINTLFSAITFNTTTKPKI